MTACLIWEFFESIENSIGARIDRDRGAIAPRNRAMSVENEQGAFGDALAAAIGAVFPCDLALGFEIGQQRKMQVTVPGKGRVAPRPVHRDAQQLCVVLAEFREDLV